MYCYSLGHGNKEVIPNYLWNPNLVDDKITVVKITREQDRIKKQVILS